MTNENPGVVGALNRLFFIGVLIVGMLTLVGFLGEKYWIFDLASNFRVQYSLFLLISAFILLANKRYKYLSFNCLILLINIACILPIYFDNTKSKENKDSSYTALVLNLQNTNNEFARVANYIQDVKPDILLLMEFSPSWKLGLDSVLKSYPSSLIEMRNDPFGIGAFTQFPMHNKRVMELGGTDIPSLNMELKIDGKTLKLFGVHWMPPFGKIGSEMRNAQMKDLEKLMSLDKSKPIMILGDINMTPWSPIFQNFESTSKLKNVRRGFGVLPTWPAKYKKFGIPLDHGFVSQNIFIKNIETGPNVGSDHLPLLIKFNILNG